MNTNLTRKILAVAILAFVVIGETGLAVSRTTAEKATEGPAVGANKLRPLLRVTLADLPSLSITLSIRRISVESGIRWTSESLGTRNFSLQKGQVEITVQESSLMSRVADNTSALLTPDSPFLMRPGDQITISPDTQYSLVTSREASAELLSVDIVPTADLNPAELPDENAPHGVSESQIATDLIPSGDAISTGPATITLAIADVQPEDCIVIPRVDGYRLLAIEAGEFDVTSDLGHVQSLAGAQALAIDEGNSLLVSNTGAEIAHILLAMIRMASPGGATPVALLPIGPRSPNSFGRND